ncbi:MAG: hypothetical protein EA382_17335 [Spirochaetaceae bacterium]|nr:MAG: hypothetical protein EA382_17335 [Spirochaetaceae bacterium]
MPAHADRPPLSYGQMFVFWIPLGIMWLMMAVEQPALAAVIARMPDAAVNLAAFGVVFAIALVAESPVLQMLSAATALTGHRADYDLLLRLMHILALSLTALHLLIGLTPLYDAIVGGLLGVPDDVLEASRWPFVVMAPFSAAVGYRRFWQGVLIRHGRTWVVPISMVLRLGLVAAIIAVGYARWSVSGAMLGAIAVSAGVTIAAATAWLLNRTLVLPTLRQPEPGDERQGWHSLSRFYVPLSLTTVVFLMANPVLTFGLARGALPELSLAVWPVISGFLFLFNSLALSYQEGAIAMLKQNPANLRRLRRFTAVLAGTLSGSLLLAAVTPVGAWWFRTVGGLPPRLLELTDVPLYVLAVGPALVTIKAWARARYVGNGRTRVLAEASIVYTVVLFTAVFIGATLVSLAGAVAAALALIVGQTAESGYLLARNPARARR